MALDLTRPPAPLQAELKAVRADAIALCKSLTETNAPLPASFPKDGVLDIARGLCNLPDGTARGCLRPLTEAQSQLARVRSEHIVHEEPVGPTSNVPPLLRGAHIDQCLTKLMSSVSTALQTAHRLAAEEPEPEGPEERVAVPRDAEAAALIGKSEALGADLKETRDRFDAIRKPSSERADNLSRQLTDVQVLNAIGRGELRMDRIVTARLKRIGQGLGEYTTIIIRSAKLIKLGADVADYAHMKLSAWEDRLFKVTTDAIREVADDAIHYVERIEGQRKPPTDPVSPERIKPPAFDLLAVEEMIHRGEAPPSEVIPFMTVFRASRRLDQKSLAALGHLISLRRLEFSGAIVDLTPLKGLTALQSLSLTGTQVSDLAPLKGLTALQSLNLYGTRVSDLTPLKGLTALQSLSLVGTKVSDLAPLKELTALQSLDLERTRVSDIAPLKGLTALQSLDLSGTQVNDLAPLQGLAALRSLDFTGTQVSDLAPLTGLTALKSLDLRSTQVSDLTPLESLPNLAEILIEKNDRLIATLGHPARWEGYGYIVERPDPATSPRSA